MARADLLVHLVQTGLQNDKSAFRKVTEAIIAEERHKQHKGLAEKLENLFHDKPVEGPTANEGGTILDQRMGNLLHEITPQRKLSELILPDDVQHVCQSLIQEQRRGEALRSHNLEPRNRVLLIGPPGNGKTSLAEAIAEALRIPLLVVRYESVVGTYLGETAVRLKKLFEYVSTRSCVLFFDEFETLGKERGDAHETGEIKRVVSSLLLQIDALPSHVMVIGATNHAELLDRAVWRRFQIRMTLPGPTPSHIKEWFEKFERRINIPLDYEPDTLAKHLQGSNFAEVEEFGATVFREYVLEQPNANMKDIVSKTLQHWAARSATVAQPEESRTMATDDAVLTKVQEQLLANLIASGRYASASEAGLQLLEQKEMQLTRIRQGLFEGLKQADERDLAEGSGEDAIRRTFAEEHTTS